MMSRPQAWALMEVKRRDVDAAKKLLDEALHFRPQDGAVWQAYALMYKVRMVIHAQAMRMEPSACSTC